MSDRDQTTGREEIAQCAGDLYVVKAELLSLTAPAKLTAVSALSLLGCVSTANAVEMRPATEQVVQHESGEWSERERRVDYRKAEAAVTSNSIITPGTGSLSLQGNAPATKIG